MVVQDSRMMYVPIMPGHKNRLPKMMTNLVKNPDKQGAVLLSVTAAAEGVGKVFRNRQLIMNVTKSALN